MATIRFGIIRTDTGGVESGACYPGCGPGNEGACVGVSFGSVAAFQAYCASHQESGVILGTADIGSPQWSALRNQALALCAPAAPASAPSVATTQPANGCCGGSAGGGSAQPITLQPISTGVTSPGIANLVGGNAPPSPSINVSSPGVSLSLTTPTSTLGPTTTAAVAAPASLMGFLTSPIGILVAFFVVFLLMGGHHSK